uniref:VWFA domain-containing protein n=1 Tax=Caenorhabditis tropicalis TaxID=1561998 RepID=A0A1I7T9V7_9PELO
MILLFCACFVVGVAGFGAPGIVPPESFIAERWYPSNLPTVMPPWKLAGVDISHFRTARPHQSPGTNPTTTTPVAPTNSLPMPPGTSSPLSEVSSNGPHPPSPPPPASAEASGLPSSSEEDTSAQNSTSPSSTEELMTLGVTATNVQTEKPEQGVLKILSPVFEDITKTDNISDSEEVLRVNSEKSIEGSGDLEPELMSTLETTTTSSKKTSTTASRTMTSESSVTTTPKPVTEPITTTSSTSSSSSTTPSTTTSSSTTKDIQDEVTTIAMTTKSEMRNTTKLRPTKECKDILFLLDSSGNVVQQYEKQKKYIEEIVHQLEAEHPRRMALITFAGRTRQKIVVPLPEEPNGIKFVEKLRKARFLRGVTAAGAAISVTTQYVLQKNRNVQVVVVTDGFSFDDVDRQSEALRAVVGMETFVTGRYFPVVKNVLLSIGGADDHVFFEKKESRLVDALQC